MHALVYAEEAHVCACVCADRTFTYEMKTPQTTYLIKQATGIKFGASKPGDEVSKALVKH